MKRVVCRFSCGTASAIATKIAIKRYGEVVIVYADTGSEHPDNKRFLADCEQWFGQKVNVVRSARYANTFEVFESRRFLVSHQGAPCTGELKRRPIEDVWYEVGDREIFGYTFEETDRLERFRKENPERDIICPLIEEGITKNDCFQILNEAGIEEPMMYRLGFRNNNCIGCVKARDNLDYWKRVRKHFPEVFQRMGALERELDTTINRVTRAGVRLPIYLDEIEPGDPRGADPAIQCGLFCGIDEGGEDE